MFKRSLGAALLLACTLPHALAQMVTITAAHLSAGGQAAISNATISFTPVLSTGQVASYRIGTTGGQSTITPIAAQVTNGAFSTTIPDTTRTAPVNLCFNVTITDNVTGAQMLGPGYGCVQPTSATNSWCSAGTCNFDEYPPNLTPMLTTSSGPTGATGPQGPQGIAGPVGTAYPGVTTDGSNGLTVAGGIGSNSIESAGGIGFNRFPATGAIANPAVFAYQFQLDQSTLAAAPLRLEVYAPGGAPGFDALKVDGTGLVTIPIALDAAQVSITGGITNAAGYQVATATGCAIAPGAVGKSCTGTVAWPVPAAPGYLGHCTLYMGAPDGTVMGPTTAGATNSIGYVLYAMTPTAAGGGEVQCWETHP
jgi:hypothetical protein